LGALYGFGLGVDIVRFSARSYSLLDVIMLEIELGMLFSVGSGLLAVALTLPVLALTRCFKRSRGHEELLIVLGTVLTVFLGSTLTAGQVTAFYWSKHPEITTYGQAMTHQGIKFALVGLLGIALACALAMASRFIARWGWVFLLVGLVGASILSYSLQARVRPPAFARSEPASARPHPTANEQRRKVFYFGIDAIDLPTIENFIREGRMPNFSRLMSRAAYAPLETLPLSDTPRVWTTLQTGKLPREHGIVSHLRWKFPGVSEPVSMPTRRKLNFLFDLASRVIGLPSPRLIVHADCRVRKIWEIASEGGLRTTVLGFYGSKPVFPIRGTVLAHGAGAHLATSEFAGDYVSPTDVPSSLYSDLEDLRVRVPSRGGRHALAISLLREVMLREEPDLLALYITITDGVGHTKMKYYRPELYGGVDPDLVARYGRDYPESFERLDEVVGEVLSLVPEHYVTIVASDHGMEPVLHEHGHSGGHAEQIDGLFLAFGPGVLPGAVPALRVEDVVPTVLALLGLPAAEDFAGRPVLDFADPSDRPQVSEIASYDAYGPPLTGEGEAEHGGMLERLRALGYVQ
jgi:hypothetical protein